MGWKPEDMGEQEDKYGSTPLAFVVVYCKKKIIGTSALCKRGIVFDKRRILLEDLAEFAFIINF